MLRQHARVLLYGRQVFQEEAGAAHDTTLYRVIRTRRLVYRGTFCAVSVPSYTFIPF